MEPNNTNTNKKVFEDLENRGRTFEDESDEFAGDDVKLTFSIKGGDENINGKSFEESFKGGQDFEFVKYQIGKALGVDSELITLIHNDKPIITLYSICDIEILADDVIIVEIQE